MNTFYKELYQNSETGLDNFLSFLTSNIEVIFGQQGTIVFLEIGNIPEINDEYGNKIGNEIVQYVASMCNEILPIKVSYTLYHFGVDTFMMIINHLDDDLVSSSFEIFEENMIHYFKTKGVNQIQLYRNIIPYVKPMNSIEAFYTFMLEYVTQDPETGLEFWFKKALSHFTKNIQHALSHFEKIVDLALHDDITGLKNHRAINQYLNHQVKHKKSTILFIDGDNLKQYNTVSYEAGNEMIAQLAQSISKSLRQEDEVFRWLSGDEFICVIDHDNQDEIYHLCERVRRNVEEASQKWLFPVTVSIGVSFWNTDLESWRTAIEQAEIATCHAKRMGKNCTVLWHESFDRSKILI
ncbi:MAG: diguanylate cyclase [Clostridia bacterium]|nr:diguanylate cyclase [Clostridia bacterium]